MGKVGNVLDALRKYYRVSSFGPGLGQSDIFRILVSTVLSQRCNDENSERAAGNLFRKYRSPITIANAPVRELERLIKPSGFYRVKARRLKEVSRIVVEKYGGKVPDSLDELVKIPGIGRKTAGCVMVYGFSKPEGIPVDTHVHRVSNRLGLVKTRTPGKTEQELMRTVPKKYWILVNELMVLHGKNICKSRNPRCPLCPVKRYCEYYRNVYIGAGAGSIKRRINKTMLSRMRND